MVLANRLVRSATWEGMAGEDGSCTPAIVDVAVQLARGGVGLIITGHAFVREDGRAGPRQMAIYDDAISSRSHRNDERCSRGRWKDRDADLRMRDAGLQPIYPAFNPWARRGSRMSGASHAGK